MITESSKEMSFKHWQDEGNSKFLKNKIIITFIKMKT